MFRLLDQDLDDFGKFGYLKGLNRTPLDLPNVDIKNAYQLP